MRLKLALLFILLSFVPFSAFAQSGPTIIVLGDSLSAAYGMEISQSWPFLLQEIALEPGLMQADGIHPTALAQPQILEQVWVVLQPLL
jgi:lysophospholipase L1-like esterase